MQLCLFNFNQIYAQLLVTTWHQPRKLFHPTANSSSTQGDLKHFIHIKASVEENFSGFPRVSSQRTLELVLLLKLLLHPVHFQCESLRKVRLQTSKAWVSWRIFTVAFRWSHFPLFPPLPPTSRLRVASSRRTSWRCWGFWLSENVSQRKHSGGWWLERGKHQMRVFSAAHKLKTNGTGPAQNYFRSFSCAFYASLHFSFEFKRGFLCQAFIKYMFVARLQCQLYVLALTWSPADFRHFSWEFSKKELRNFKK